MSIKMRKVMKIKEFYIKSSQTNLRGKISKHMLTQRTMWVQALAIIIYLGLNCIHCIGAVWSLVSTHTLDPVSVFQMCTLPSVEPVW